MLFLVFVGCLGIFHAAAQSFGVPKMSKAEEKMAEAKGMADEMGVTEEQMFECFSDMNCNLGKEIKDEMFGCYNKVKPEEVPIYTKWFGDSPKGNFIEYTMLAVNTEFCSLSRPDQREVNDFFAKKFTEEIETLCKTKNQISKCRRVKDAWTCIQHMFEKYIPDGTCNGTIVAKAEDEWKQE